MDRNVVSSWDQTQIDSDSAADKFVPVPFPIDIDVFVAEDCFESAAIPRGNRSEVGPGKLAYGNRLRAHGRGRPFHDADGT
jgi:hypothetical protein